jgi:hypothetical protein
VAKKKRPVAQRSRAEPPPAARRARAALLVFAAAFLVYNLNLRRVGAYDTLAASLIPFNIWNGDGLALDRLVDVYPSPMNASIIKSHTGHWVSFYPIVAPLLVTPLYLVWAVARPFGIATHLTTTAWILEKPAAAFLAAASVAILFLLLDRIATRKVAWILTIAFALATPTWSISSQALWQHGASELLLAAALLLLLEPNARGFGGPQGPPLEHSSGRLAALGVLAGLLTASRPVNIFFSLAIAILVLRRSGRRALPFVLTSAAVALLWLAYNKTYFVSWVGGYGDYRLGDGRPLWMASNGLAGTVGLLLSNRGLLFFCPYLLLFFYSPRRALRAYPGLGVLLLAFLAFLYVTARTPDWPGGMSYGPRLLTDAFPVLILALAGPLEGLASLWGRSLFALGVSAAFAFQAIGAFCFPGGDSGNESLGLWTLDRSGPVVAFRAGFQTPHYVDLFARSFVQEHPLPEGASAALAWAEPLPGSLRAREGKWIAVEVRNRGEIPLTSLGGWQGIGGLTMTTFWEGTPGSPPYVSPDENVWVALRLSPGASVVRKVFVTAPNTVGSFRLCVGFSQIGFGRVPRPGMSPRCQSLEVLPGRKDLLARWGAEWAGGKGPETLGAGSEGSYRVGIRSVGRASLPANARIAYHWQPRVGGQPLFDGLATSLPSAPDSDGFSWVDARVSANVSEGIYELQFDLLSDHWFSLAGWPPLRVKVAVVQPKPGS